MSKKRRVPHPGKGSQQDLSQRSPEDTHNPDDMFKGGEPGTESTSPSFAAILGDDWEDQLKQSNREPGIEDTLTSMPAVLQGRGAPAPEAQPQKVGGGTGGPGDTLRMPSIKPGQMPPSPDAPPPMKGPVQPRMPSGLRKRLIREQTRVGRLPKRRTRLRGFGFFWWVFGFFGLIFRMLLATAIVMGLAAVIGYYAISSHISTPEVVVPNVKGTRLETAVDILSEKGLSLVKEGSEPSALVSPGEIIDQRPPAGQRTKQGSTIFVDVASGRARFMVPDVLGETKDNALNKIKGANLEVGDLAYIESDKPVDTVINQSPEPKKGLDASTKVNLLLSSGPRGRELSMPELTGRSLADAKSTLAQMGVTNIVVEPAGSASGTVSGQDPLVGKGISQAQQVTLRVTP